MTMPDLIIDGLEVRFGGLQAVSSLSLTVSHGEIHSLIGPNGAGKTSVINVVTGHYPAQQGSVRFGGVELLRRRPHAIAAQGLARTFQNVELFPEMTVEENVLIGGHRRLTYGFLSSVLRTPGCIRAEREERAEADMLLSELGLSSVKHTPARQLPLGKQRRVELARALASSPKLLLLDEPAAGMAAAEAAEFNSLLRSIRQQRGLTILLVEHVMQVVMEISDRITVLHHGRKIADGSPKAIQADENVIKAYLGERGRRAAG